MEGLLQYIWQHKLWLSEDMVTNDGLKVRVIDPGLLNTDAGPDFFNAKIEIDGRLWVGNVEIHVRASDWKRHHHDEDPAYDSVILHVVEKDDAPVTRINGERIPQVELRVSPRFNECYDRLVNAQVELPCAARLKEVPSLTITEWIEALAFERLHGKVDRVSELYERYHGSWEDICYVMLARTLGFGINNDAFERLARITPLRLLHKHSDSLLQVEALLFGQSGLLNGAHSDDTYYQQLTREYAFLANKFSLRPIDGQAWRLFRSRPQNFPYRRIALLAQFIHDGFNLMNDILHASDTKALRQLFDIELSGYWTTHFSFGKPSPSAGRALSNSSIDIVLINTVAPLFYAYGELTDDSQMTDRAIALLEDIRPEQNSIVTMFCNAGIKCDDALTSQALIQLRRNYCEARKCIYCRLGHRLLATDARRLPTD
ncbi:MAG: DUF2851 family protein [Muribaculaceae bacterium]|nr:DUF2851 family protein [Muribaculaceae bacterium]